MDVTLQLETSTDDYRFICSEIDWNLEDEVIMEIGECHLIVPVGQLHPKVGTISFQFSQIFN